MKSQFIGVGVGPGDPGLITLKAANYIQQADVISYIANKDGVSQAKSIAQSLLVDNANQQYVPVLMPMSEDRSLANAAYDSACDTLLELIQQGKQVVFLCEGDPLFFASFAYVLDRLQDQVSCEVVPGISSVHAASAALQLPLTMLTESFAVVSGRNDQNKIESALRQHDTVVIMKAGRARPRILDALKNTQRMNDAQYLEYIGRDSEKITQNVEDLEYSAGPYFSLFVITKQTRDHRS